MQNKNMSDLINWFNSPGISDLGENALVLLDLVKTKKNSRFMDIGVRGGVSSAILSYQNKENNNTVCGCDINFDLFFSRGKEYVDDSYTCYLYDSVTLGKTWDEDPFDIIFIDSIHTWDQVLAELYFWSNHLKEGGYFVFHDSHWEEGNCENIGGVVHKRVDEAITDFFNLSTNVMKMNTYEDENIRLEHYPSSSGMTFVQIKTLDVIEKLKSNVDWKEVFKIRNRLVDLVMNTNNPECISGGWGLDYDKITYEPVITI
jgi:predicted O-methyltransferase YrrM